MMQAIRSRAQLLVLTVAALCLLPEVLLSGADAGLWGSAQWRPFAYHQGAFWAGLLHGWRPNFAAQPVTMFLSYSWLHAGAAHLAANLVVLALIGPRLARSLGARRFWAAWLLCAAGGGLGFALIAPGPAPMVGASGALFGLAALWLVLGIRRSASPQRQALRIAGAVLLLAGLTLGDGLLLQTGQAWQAHLGGALTGLALVPWMRRKRAATPKRPPA